MEAARPIRMRRQTQEWLEAHGVRPRRGLGQSFLVSPGIAQRIVDAAAAAGGLPLSETLVVELGPGTGALTEGLLKRAGHLLAVEVDRRLHSLLGDRFGHPPNATWVLGDALTYPYAVEVPRLALGRPALVVANLPYASATAILLRLLGCGRLFAALVVMLQREVADRLVAAPGAKAYGPLSLAVQMRAAARCLFGVAPAAFYPRPAVASAVVEVRPHLVPPVPAAEWAAVENVVRAGFRHRRKMLRQALAAGGRAFPPAMVRGGLEAAGIDGRRRGETLSLAEFRRLARALSCPGWSPAGRGEA